MLEIEHSAFIQTHMQELEQMGKQDPGTSISELARNQRKISARNDLYYEERQDQIWIEYYYSDERNSLVPHISLFERYHELITTTHKYQLPYFVSKDQYLYTWVDLHPDGRLKGIYSGETKMPEQAIEEDFETIQKRYVRFRQLIVNNRFAHEEHLHQIKAIEREHKFNTEHIVPQSWFRGQEPMKGDLHHLFVCDPKCNTARANYPYHEFRQGHPSLLVNHPCGAWEEGKFEPRYGKGMVARAFFYFLLRYPGAIMDSFREGLDLSVLLRWNMESPVSEYEKHRNKAIFEIQGNRNPFVDMPHLAEEIDFELFMNS